MFKMLVIDRCYFTRSGMESWLNQTDMFPATFLVTALHNLMLAKEHIVQWQPDLVIIDLHSFKDEIHHIQQLASLFSVCGESVQVMLLESGEDPLLSEFYTQFPIQAIVQKTASLEEVAQAVDAMVQARPVRTLPRVAAPLLTRQEEKVLTLWMEGRNNAAIATKLCINGKTVYTYKRNIRMKLGMGNRFTPFLSLPEN
ncbi:LuxR C-terminal-related transcriptional regulator [Kosakonia sp. H02]|nr:LuxR C-terminal-related transcriptional regulator [Kosakonia sp. H02]